ncbi:MAG: hypothetical protein ACI9UA_003081 [Pseudoalteromonas tetraodonis]|jgi:hypothetical protein
MLFRLLTIMVCWIVWIANSGAETVDGFVAEKLNAQGLERQAEADRYTLLRRLTADLTGLPPSVEEMQAFVTDKSPDAYEKLVDHLLDDPRFGERWGRHWLDVARFGESDGILTVNEDQVRGDAWKYRDAVIRAFNADLPFDQFVRYQINGSEKPDYQALKQFIHLGTRLQNNADPNDKMFHRLDDMVATTGNAFLATTFGCARCHDHPVDPMTTEEYYQFTAIYFDQFKQEAKASQKKIALRITEPRVLKKGSWMTPGEKVEPGFLRTSMAKPADYWQRDAPSKLGALASWITDVEHGAGKQLARVIVNRLWHHHFGRGIVATPNDFGELGAEPTHPELLDRLAGELIENGWRLKHIHRLILTSATYRQTGVVNPAALSVDAEHKWLWQRRPQRLEAEMIRDRLLSVAGALKPKMFGPSLSIGAYKKPVADTPEKWRRSIYLQAHRTVSHPTLSLFDPPDSERSTGSRNTGASPEGALFALNSPLVWDLAGRFAQRVESEVGVDPAAQAERAYLHALSRPPQKEELELSLTLLQNGTLKDFCHILLGLNEFIYVH